MLEITFKNIEKYYGVTQILEAINFDVHTGEKIGVIGRNGTGKTTLFKIAAGIEDYQGGQLFTRRGLQVAYLDQMPSYEDSMKVKDVLRLSYSELYAIQSEMRSLEAQMSDTEDLETVMKRYASIQERFEHEGGYAIEEEIGKISTGLGFKEAFLNKPFKFLSGGQKTLVEFARILAEAPDVLLLDEPTNHLDFKAITWLEDYLRNYSGAVLIISHDRYFLDQVVGQIVEIDDGKSDLYNGNYTYYVAEKERRIEEMLKAYNNQQKKIKSMQEAVYRFKEWGRVSDDQRFFKKAQNMEKRIEKMDKVDRPRTNRRNLMLSLKDQNRSGKEVLMIENLSKGFYGKTLFKNLNLDVYYQDAFALVGSNGCGKSTLLKAVLGTNVDYKADSGQIRLAKNAKIAFLEQEVRFFDETLTVLESVTQLKSITDGNARHLLASYLFVGDEVFKQLKDLSGGERSRLRLCHLLMEDVNFMILDEPTNHLDIPSREMLEEALIDFSGTLLFVSHDRYFINRIAQEVYEMEPMGLKRYIGNYDDYFEKKAEVKESESDDRSSKIKDHKLKKKRGNRHAFTKKKLEEDIESFEIRLIQLGIDIEEAVTDHLKLTELMAEKRQVEVLLEEAMDSWIEIAD
jgi:ATPase subunit of ABC transporter with duplicated ATPase domains